MPVKVASKKAPKIRTKAQYLEKKYGGKWKYDGMATWWCDDEKRHVSRTSSCTCDDYCNHPPIYYLYGDGNPKVVYFLEMATILIDLEGLNVR